MVKYFITIHLFLSLTIHLAGQVMEYRYNQLFISPFASFGSSTIIRQNNYGYSTLAYAITPGYQTGIYFGREQYLKTSFKTGVMFSSWGQHYRDVLSGRKVEKTVKNNYLQIPLAFRFVFGEQIGYRHGRTPAYVQGSLILGFLTGSAVHYYRETEDGFSGEETLVDFVTFGGWNQNSPAILEKGNPLKDRHLFIPYDVSVELAYGYQKFITSHTLLWAELHGSFGITDINAPSWRFRNNKNIYYGSYNAYAGIKIGANLYIN